MEKVNQADMGFFETAELYGHDYDHRICKNCFINMKKNSRHAGAKMYCPFCRERIHYFYTLVTADYEHPDPYVPVVIDT
jgi:hypothetical protein